ncbi:porin family protein [Mucilaginibacter agri]|uniref:Outer membrane protein beta-barrel domain-containing protein n=1 Tax=Mucilaginibacter agri TaxID=2695265 RepID=A0A966DSZ2_9SPHI|nr:porin family protein [Mucilaginibacter agri]NCD70703.1 hypothetical protein [Mucilaginibacter agri]
MKIKLTLILFVLLFAGAKSFAQQVRLNAYGVYAFEDNVDSYYDANNYYNGKINGSFMWGAGAEYMALPHTGVELLYMRQDTKAPLTYYYRGAQFANFDLANNFIMIGANQYFRKPGGIVEGFAGASVGADVISIKNPNTNYSDTPTKFAFGLKAGANFWISPVVGIKLQAQLLSAVQSVGGAAYFGTGGAGVGVGTASSMLQFGLGGGLVFNLNAK